MHNWVKRKMVPVFDPNKGSPVCQGMVRSLWLGGLVNPKALFTALKQEKAVISNCLIDQVLSF